MKKIILILFVFLVNNVHSQFIVQDVRIGDFNASYLDFEFWQEGNRVCFQDENNFGYVGLMNPTTGDLVSASGKDYLFDATLAPITNSLNGPEWGYKLGDADVFFTKQNATTGNRSIGKASWNGTNYDVTNLSASLTGKRFATLCSKNATDTNAKLIYAKGNNILNFTINYSEAINPVSDTPIPYGANSSSGPRFIDGEQALITNDIVNSVTQIFKYDFFTPTPTLTQLTFDSGDKIDAFIFTAPDFGGAQMMFCTVNNNTIRLYKNIAGSFVFQYNIQIPNPAYTYYFSAEPFVFQNKSYLFLCAANQQFIPGSQNNSQPADVWLVGLEQNTALYRKVSDNRVALRLDPEVFITPTEAYIYYYEYFENGNIHPVSFRKCSSGLGSNLLSNSSSNLESNTVYPNPFDTKIFIKNKNDVATFILFDNLGRTVYSGKDIEEHDFSNLNLGMYYLKTINFNNINNTTKLLKR